MLMVDAIPHTKKAFVIGGDDQLFVLQFKEFCSNNPQYFDVLESPNGLIYKLILVLLDKLLLLCYKVKFWLGLMLLIYSLRKIYVFIKSWTQSTSFK